MFERATKYFTDLLKSDEYNNDLNTNGAKSFGGAVLAQPQMLVCEHENVWCWSPSDVEEITVVRMPQQIYNNCETVMVIYEKFFHREIGGKLPQKEIWYCDDSQTLDNCLKVIKHNFLL